MIWALRRCVAAPSLALLLLLPVIAADPYDNGVIAAGRLIGAGPLLEGLSWWRYLLHVVSLPCWIVAMVLLAGRAGVRWAQTQLATVAAALIAVAVVGATLTRELLPLSLERIMRGDVLLYVDANQAGPPLGPLVVMAVALVCGVAIERRTRWPWVALATLSVLLVSDIPNAIISGVLINAGELLLALALLAAERRFVDAPLPQLAEARAG